MQLFTQEELQALVGLFSRTPMTLAEQQFVMTMMNRLVAYCQPPPAPAPQEPEEPDDNQRDV